MKILLRAFAAVHAVMALLFTLAALVLMGVSARAGWEALAGGLTDAAGQQIIEAIGMLAAAVVALQIAQTITEEEVVREEHVSAPTRVRRFLSRFFVVLIVALAIEGLVATFKGVHEGDMSELVYASVLTLSTAALLAAWGLFIRLNRSAEELEPEAMEEAKREDKKFG
jgi:hypothetical protein